MKLTKDKKSIKILIYADATDNKVGQSVQYMEFMSQFGEVILVHPQNDLELFMSIGDLLLVPGGLDVNPSTTGEIPSFTTTRANPNYEYLDKYLLAPWIVSGKPVVGICRGAQAINIALGGTLHQNIKGHVQWKPRTEETEEMYTSDPSFNVVDINSFHHQSVNKLGNGLNIIGWSTATSNCPTVRAVKSGKLHGRFGPKYNKNGHPSKTQYHIIVEAFESNSTAAHNVLAFQYHPEELNCAFAYHKITNLINSL